MAGNFVPERKTVTGLESTRSTREASLVPHGCDPLALPALGVGLRGAPTLSWFYLFVEGIELMRFYYKHNA